MTTDTSVPALDELLTPAAVSDYLDVPTGTLANWRYRGSGPPFVRLGRHVRYRAVDLDDWLRSNLQPRVG